MLVVWAFSGWSRAVASSASALAIYVFIDGCWAYRSKWWLWAMLLIVTMAHLALVCLVNWPDWGKGNLLMIIVGLVEGVGLQVLVSWFGTRAAE